MRARELLSVVVLLFAAVGCVHVPSAKLPRHDRPYIAVLSGELLGTFRELGRHSWIVANVRSPAGAWYYRKFEWLSGASATDTDNPFYYFGGGEVAVHGVVTGSPDELAAKVACLEEQTKRYHEANCGCWPGPNSNTFADGLIRACGLGVELPATAVGKDYRGPIGVSTTEGRTGVQLETWLGGVKIGLKEGIGADLVGLSLGVHAWPPGIDVPVGRGRIGVDPSAYYSADHTVRDRFAWLDGDRVEHRLGAASLAISLGYDRVDDAGAAFGLSDRSLARFRGNAVFGKSVGYAFGFDIGLGGSAPLGFAYEAHLFPAGIGVVLGDTGFVAAFSGIGTSGASSTVRAALELPEELRLELDVGHTARIGLRGGVILVPDADGRKWFESVVGTSARLGTRASGRDGVGAGSGGFFIGLERRQLSHSFILGVSFGYELGVGG